jgi:hypothetical protein
MRYVLAFLLLGHGIAHLPGFIVASQLGSFPDLPFRTTVFGTSWDIGVDGMRLMGLGWITAAVALVALAATLALGAQVPPPVSAAVLGLSLVLCAAGWPEARLGLVANAVIAASLLAAMRYGALA